MIAQSHFILYVKDQIKSTEFYSKLLNIEPVLNVPGMTEFRLSEGTILGLMPIEGINRLLDGKIKDPALAAGIPGGELYLRVDNIEVYLTRALQNGGALISEPQLRNWGDRAAYILDPDNYVIAFAEKA